MTPAAESPAVALSAATLHPVIESELRGLQHTLSAEGVLRPQQQLQSLYDTFKRRFSPDALRTLDGLALLERMHAHGNRESLVYWLEFKDDEEFPGIFGSIAGGSAMKFGVYRRSETGTWAIQGPGRAPQDIPVEQAIEIALRHRDQLSAAANLVAGVPAGATDVHYLALQRALEKEAPDVQDSAWGHKYLALLFPNTLDDFHVETYQRYHLVRVLQAPPREADRFIEGRYACAGRFVALARALELPLHSASTLLNRRHGRPQGYWRVGTTDDERARRKYWPMMRDGGIVAIGWSALGDLTGHSHSKDSKEAIGNLLVQSYPGSPQSVGRAATQVMKFVAGMQEGDRVLAGDGMAMLGVGEIVGGYQFVEGAHFPHQRSVRWRSLVEWRNVDAEALRTTVAAIRDYRNQVEAERHILDDANGIVPIALPKPIAAAVAAGVREPDIAKPRRHDPLPRLLGIPGLVQSVLERKGQAVLYGPPGTGKTHWALRTARDLASLRAFSAQYLDLNAEQRRRVVEGSNAEASLVRTCSFHPEYGYEDFIEGFRPRTDDAGQLSFSLLPGIFRRLCVDAERAPSLAFYLVIDEINRGDIPRIFGELLTLLERDKRGQPLLLPVSGESFRVPLNVFVIGTMNTADRSIALLDVALRRRFGFVELIPDYDVLGTTVIAGLPLGAWLADLNRRVTKAGGGDARNRQIGHSFLLDHGEPITGIEQLIAVLRDDIVPLLEEYCYDDFAQLADVLGRTLVDVSGQRVRRELLNVGRAPELIAALMSPEIATAAAAVFAAPDESAGRVPDENDDGGEEDEGLEGADGGDPRAT